MRAPVIVAVGLVGVAAIAAAVFLLGPDAPAPAEPAPPPPVAAAPSPEPAPAPAPEPAPVAPAPAPRRPAPARTPAPTAPPVAEAAPTTGTLHIETDVDGATVFLDRVGVGTAPMTIPDVTPGSHRLNVSAKGYDGYAETINVEPGERTISIRFKDIRLDARIDAVHKHGMGSCRGRLVASPQGIRYEAADGKDSFSVAFADVAAFDVDYLEKNLRLRTRQGRTYNFTDPGGSADPLFAFHEEVDKVRKRVVTP